MGETRRRGITRRCSGPASPSTAATPCRIPDRPSILDFPSSDSSARPAPLPSSLCRSRLLDFRVVLREIFFLWRPFLRDPRDDMVLELAVEAECDAILTYNQRDFAGVEQFGLRANTPKEFLQEIGEIG